MHRVIEPQNMKNSLLNVNLLLTKQMIRLNKNALSSKHVVFIFHSFINSSQILLIVLIGENFEKILKF